jgi:hypothetical protein
MKGCARVEIAHTGMVPDLGRARWRAIEPPFARRKSQVTAPGRNYGESVTASIWARFRPTPLDVLAQRFGWLL